MGQLRNIRTFVYRVIHRKGAENAEMTQRKIILSHATESVLCISAVSPLSR